MQRTLLKSKIHGARVTQANLYYEGSITIDETLMERSDIVENERVQVVNCNNGARFETYVIKGRRGGGEICLNGPAARLGAESDTVHILSYALIDEDKVRDFHPVILLIGEGNEIIDEKH